MRRLKEEEEEVNIISPELHLHRRTALEKTNAVCLLSLSGLHVLHRPTISSLSLSLSLSSKAEEGPSKHIIGSTSSLSLSAQKKKNLSSFSVSVWEEGLCFGMEKKDQEIDSTKCALSSSSFSFSAKCIGRRTRLKIQKER